MAPEMLGDSAKYINWLTTLITAVKKLLYETLRFFTVNVGPVLIYNEFNLKQHKCSTDHPKH
jgi:hypothetical protein